MSLEKWKYVGLTPSHGKKYAKGNNCLVLYSSGRHRLFINIKNISCPACCEYMLEKRPGRGTLRVWMEGSPKK